MAGVAPPGLARASAPSAVKVKPSRIEWEPNKDAPDLIRVYGPLSLWGQNAVCSEGPSPRPGHPAPTCGSYLYYRCPAGRQALCRMEWKDLQRALDTGTTASFGDQLRLPRPRPLGEAPSAPDEYTFNFGVMVDEGFFCTRAEQWVCQGDTPDAGADRPAVAAAPDTAPDIAAVADSAAPPNGGGGSSGCSFHSRPVSDATLLFATASTMAWLARRRTQCPRSNLRRR